MRKINALMMFLAVMGSAFAQIEHGGEPNNWELKDASFADVPFFTTPKLDLEAIKAEDAVVDQYKETPYRFGYDHEVDINFFDMAEVETTAEGNEIYRMGIHCPKGTSVNFNFGSFYLPEGTELFVWTEDRENFIGSFTSENNKEYGSLALSILFDDKVIIEYHQPADVEEMALLNINQISHGYRGVLNKWADKGPHGTSGSCNMNVNCPDAVDWQDEKRGVALILSGGSAHCTGSLVNNTNQDETPYFLTAAHCDGNEGNWVMYFMHEYPGCSNTGIVPNNLTISGGTELASSNPSDVHLIQLSSAVPQSYEPYYNGWDHSGAAVPLAVGIHHPAGDVKKISFDDDPLTITQYLQNAVGSFDHWRVEMWERNTTTEGGSSGSPLFDQNHRIIGQLHGGYASCSSNTSDWYGAMHTSWPFLQPYLDPSNSATTLDGWDPYGVIYNNDAQAGSILGTGSEDCEAGPINPTFTLKNNGTSILTNATIEYSYNGTAQSDINWTGSLGAGESEIIALATMITVSGENTIVIDVTAANDENDGNNSSVAVFQGTIADATGYVTLQVEVITDSYGSETTWELKNPMGVVVLSGGPYADDSETYDVQPYTIPAGAAGCYEFTIYDSFGDGICCTYGDGAYGLFDEQGTQLVLGGTFGESETSIINMQTSIGIDETTLENSLNLYPNPTQDMININLPDFENYQIQIFNLLGEVVYNGNSNGLQLKTIDVANFAKGMYVLTVKNETQSAQRNFVVK